ncbi:phospholipase B1, membrane-associated-like [Mytilus edulis]|uniref:phospholipase B1, membrane-associated-like n=1 Tax=Mytilus edulis TaxID=6550 RepID=UPI0039EE1E91
MEPLRYFCCFILVFTTVNALKFKEYKHFLEEQSRNQTFLKLFDQHIKKFNKAKSKSVQFPCEGFRLNKNATNVHELTPADISVVAAIGDSITAGTGITAKTPIGLLRQDRGLSWSVGGDGNVDEHITLANMLKRYNPNLVGFSVGSGDFESENAHLNVADPGNEARNMPFQARLLVDRMKSGKEGVDFVNDWKVITMFIGGNDLCDYCGDRPEYTVEKYIGYITEALDIFHKEVPKAFVNVVEVLDIGNVPLLNENLVCDTLHYFTCRCGAFPGDNKDELKALVIQYQNGLEDLVDSGRYDTRDDFTVVNQPFLSETKIPVNDDNSTDLDYFAPDCFHFSELGQEVAASALWDNMIEPVGQKRTYWRPGEPSECPDTEEPYFYTKKNSKRVEGVGSYRQQTRQENRQPDANARTHQFSSTSVAGIVIGALCIMIVVSLSVYYLKQKRKQNSVERYQLLHGSSPNYTEV